MQRSPDNTELFLHLSDDALESYSTEDNTTRSLQNLLKVLRLAQLHDLEQATDAASTPQKQQGPKVHSELTNEANKISLDTAEQLFKTLQPYLDEYLKHGLQNSHLIHSQEHVSAALEADNEDTTFEPASLPITSPPLSRDSHFSTSSRETAIEHNIPEKLVHDSMHREAQQEKHIKATSKENLENNYQIPGHIETDYVERTRMPPHVELGDLTSEEIQLSPAKKAGSDADLESRNQELSLQLRAQVSTNAELLNEINYLKSRLELKGTVDAENSGPSRPPLVSGHQNISEEPVTRDSVAPEFRQFYDSLKLDLVDKLSSTQKSNFIKNTMLSLLVSDLDHWPEMMPQVGSYLRLSAQFLDSVHSQIYGPMEFTPSQYLGFYGVDVDSRFEKCLEGMLQKITVETDEKNHVANTVKHGAPQDIEQSEAP